MSYIYDEEGNKKYYQVNYIQKYYEELFYGLLEEAYDVSLISHNENFIDYVKSRQDISSFYVMTLSILADEIEDVYFDITDVYYSDKIQYAIGSDLDDIGLRVGCLRPRATKAGVTLSFKLSVPFDVPIEINTPITVSNGKGVEYVTTGTLRFPIGETVSEVFALSSKTGRGFRVEADTLHIIEEEVVLEDGTIIGLSVTNPKSSSGGNEKYNDEEYRELLLDWVKNNIKGSKEAYERYFANLDGVDSYKLIPNWNGVTGTVKVVVDPGDSEQLNNIYDDLNGVVTQFSEDITLFPPTFVPIDIYAVCDVDIDVINPYSSSEKEAIKSRIKEAIIKYIEGDLYSENRKEHLGLTIGEDFIPYKLGVYLSQKIPELKNIGFKYPLNPITITDEEMCTKNEITIEMNSVPTYKEIDLDSDGNADILGVDLNNDSMADLYRNKNNVSHGLK